MTLEEEREIWERFQRGDKNALSVLYRQYASLLFAYGMKIGQDKELVGDCIQDLFVYLYDKRKNIAVPVNVKAYLLLSLKRRIIQQIDGESKNNEKVFSLDAGDIRNFNISFDLAETLENSDMKEDQIRALQKAIQTLSPQQREVLYLRYFNKLSVGEVAEVIGKSKQTVMNVASTAISRLREDKMLSDIFSW